MWCGWNGSNPVIVFLWLLLLLFASILLERSQWNWMIISSNPISILLFFTFILKYHISYFPKCVFFQSLLRTSDSCKCMCCGHCRNNSRSCSRCDEVSPADCQRQVHLAPSEPAMQAAGRQASVSSAGPPSRACQSTSRRVESHPVIPGWVRRIMSNAEHGQPATVLRASRRTPPSSWAAAVCQPYTGQPPVSDKLLMDSFTGKMYHSELANGRNWQTYTGCSW